MADQPASGDDRVKTSFSLSAALRKRIKIAAAVEERDMSELVAEAVEAYLSKKHTALPTQNKRSNAESR